MTMTTTPTPEHIAAIRGNAIRAAANQLLDEHFTAPEGLTGTAGMLAHTKDRQNRADAVWLEDNADRIAADLAEGDQS